MKSSGMFSKVRENTVRQMNALPTSYVNKVAKLVYVQYKQTNNSAPNKKRE